MPVSPKQCKDHIGAEDKKRFDEVVRSLDNSLMREYHGQGAITVTISSVNDRIKDMLRRAYTEAGWKVMIFKTTHDQRDGDYHQVTLSEYEQTSYLNR